LRKSEVFFTEGKDFCTLPTKAPFRDYALGWAHALDLGLEVNQGSNML